MVITETDKACAAGWLDGEGCINIGSRISKSGSPSHRLTVIIANNDLRPLKWMHDRWGGCGCAQGKGRANVGFSLRLTGHGAVKFLKDVKPYLLIKSDQADVAIDFQEKLFDLRSTHREDELARREECKQELHRLKTAHFTPANDNSPFV